MMIITVITIIFTVSSISLSSSPYCPSNLDVSELWRIWSSYPEKWQLWLTLTVFSADATRTAPRILRNGSSHTCNMGKKRWQLLFLKSYSSGKYLHTSPGHRYLKLMYLKNRNHLLKFQRSTTTHFYTWKIKRKSKSSGREYHCTPYKSNCSILQQ